MKRIYIAGPMTGKPDLNRAEFLNASIEIVGKHEELCDIVNPHHVGAAREWTESTCVRTIAEELLKHLVICDAIYMLRGWQDSKGATAEHAVAKWIGLEIIYQGEGE